MFRFRHVLLPLSRWQKSVALIYLALLMREVVEKRLIYSGITFYKFDVKLCFLLCLVLCILLNRKLTRLFMLLIALYCCYFQVYFLLLPMSGLAPYTFFEEYLLNRVDSSVMELFHILLYIGCMVMIFYEPGVKKKSFSDERLLDR